MSNQIINFEGTKDQVVNGTVDILGTDYQVIDINSSDETLNILGGSYNPTLNYIIVCDNGNDTITGGSGHDIIFAGSGTDTISGGLGGSVIFGGSGTDVMAGYLVSLNIADGSESQPLAQSVNAGTLNIPGNVLIGGIGTESIYGISQLVTDQTIGAGISVMLTETANSASNTLTAGSGTDLLVGDFGSQQVVLKNITFNVGEFLHGNTLIAGSGTDTLFGNWGTLNSTISGVSGHHPFTGGSNLLVGGSGSDLLIGDAQSFIINATNSSLQTNGTLGHNTLIAGSGATTMIGDFQNLDVSTDSVSNGVSFALGGNTLIAGTGNDVMVGSVQSLDISPNVVITYDPNTFQFALNQHLGHDSILDFNANQDILEFTGVQTVSGVDSLIKSFSADSNGHGTLVTFKNGGSIDFQDIGYTHQHSILDLVNHQLTHIVVAV